MQKERETHHPKVVRLGDPRYVDVDGIRTCYHEAGSGPETILFVYGGNFGSADSAGSASTWKQNYVPLSDKHRVVAFDKLGQGYTDPPLRDEDYTMGAVVAHTIGLLEILKLPPVHIVGHSRGGFVAARVAMERPDLVRSLTIVTSSTLSPGVGLNEVTLARPPHPPFTREAARWVYERYCFKPETVTDEWIDSAMDVLAQPNYRKGVAKMVDGQLGARLFIPDLARYKRETLTWIDEGRLQRPTQIIWGLNDPTAVLERGVRLFDAIAIHERRVTFNVFNESGHFPFIEHTNRFNALLDRFVDLYRA